jgi:hypothetical protein
VSGGRHTDDQQNGLAVSADDVAHKVATILHILRQGLMWLFLFSLSVYLAGLAVHHPGEVEASHDTGTVAALHIEAVAIQRMELIAVVAPDLMHL